MTEKKVPLQQTSIDIWEQKYQLKDSYGELVDHTIDDTFERISVGLSKVEESNQEQWKTVFKSVLGDAVPAGRIAANVEAQHYKPATSVINCTVSGTIEDSMKDILYKVVEAGLTLKAGCGIGYEFSTLRPKGAFVSGAGAYTSGPLSFMDIFDKSCFTVSSAGGRRGAQMAALDVRHPDVYEFIKAKREDGRFRQFNLSLLITKDFIEAVRADEDWSLIFPVLNNDTYNGKQPEELNEETGDKFVWANWPEYCEGILNDKGEYLCKIHRTVRARELWDFIMTSTYDYAEPGFIMIDEYNKMNNNFFCEEIRTTNPCGEQGLPPYGSCLLGQINLTQFVTNPFKHNAAFDWGKFKHTVRIFTRMLDNVVEINGLPLPQQVEEITRKRRHGMGYFGLGSALTLMGIKYGSPESILFTETVTKTLAIEGWKTALELSKEKGPAPIMEEDFMVTKKMLLERPRMVEDEYIEGASIKGKVLHAKYSHYMNRIAEVEPELVEELAKYGARFTHHTSIAPTGTVALSFGNNASNGIEPSFSHHYSRNVIKEGKKSKDKVDVFSYELLAYRALVNPNAMPNATNPDDQLPDYFVSASTLTPKEHIDIQAAAQPWIDSSISKTINVPTDFTFDEFKDIYLYAEEKGLKGCTTFRYNPEAFQGVLVNEEDLENTEYVFTTETGENVVLKGNETVIYDGESHTAANLYDAIKEGYYGKF